MEAEITELSPRQHADDLCQTWQGRMLVHTRRRTIGAVVLSILAHYFETGTLLVLLKAVFPDFVSVNIPFYCSAAKVDKRGHVVADMVLSGETLVKDTVVFKSLNLMKEVLRRLADEMKLTDQERKEFFFLAQKWVVADRRLDPNMDPADPDAKRLTVN